MDKERIAELRRDAAGGGSPMPRTIAELLDTLEAAQARAEEAKAQVAALRDTLGDILSEIEDDDQGDGTNSQGILLFKVRNAKADVCP